MDREVVGHTLHKFVLLALFAAAAAACGGGSGNKDAYAGGPLTTNDIANPTLEVPPVSSAGFHDTFSGPDGQPLAGRQPETTASTNSVWLSPATTNWRTKDGALVLDTTANRDFRAVVDVGRPRNWVRGRIVREAGMAGLVVRYSDEKKLADGLVRWHRRYRGSKDR
jgi:hypothetical protein